ncbi:hypothetical protein SY27_16230 [Flavobacterium sp. 316]|uniref:restriction endonuclease subunit S n=1 Tax=Flavobacterium sp. 316 TaxID=1603293 RepID=UPI0005E4A54C|nr:restriction endonuclease subunit S [Flavobacterium sp. 316]KIX20062.1 hypothetical protein SY27_16230 [Flavobacterium sp. 316]
MQLLEHFASLTLHPKNAQELKGLILQLAIQGNLTANWRKDNPDIEPSSELLKRIKKEKAQLIKEKKVRKGKANSKVSNDDKYLEVPENWEWSRIIEIGNLFNGNSVNKAIKETKYEGLEKGFPYLGTKDINYGFEKLNYENGVKIPYNEPKFKIAHKDTPLICSEGGSAGKKCGITTNDICFGNKLYALELYGKIEPVLILSLYQTPIFFDEFQNRMTGIIGGISINSFGDIPVPIPPLQEQKEIVRVVEILFKEVEQLEQLTVERISLKEKYVSSALQQLTTQNSQKEWQSLQHHFKDFFTEKSTIKKLRETVLQLAVQGKLTADWRTKNTDFEHASELLKRIQKEKAQLIKDKKIKKESPLPAITAAEIPYELPEGWVWCRFGYLITFLNGYAFKSSTYVPTSDYQIIRLGNVKDDNFLINTKEAYVPSSVGEVNLDYQIFKDDILTTLTGTKNRRDYCFTCLVKPEHLEQKVLLLNQRVGCIRAIDKSASELINKFLKSDIILNQLFETETGTANQGNIGSTAFKNLVFPLPPLAEQKAIIEKVNALMGLCDALEQEVEKSKGYSEQLMQSVLREVFNTNSTN